MQQNQPETDIMQKFKEREPNQISSKNLESPCFDLRDIIMENKDTVNRIESKVKAPHRQVTDEERNQFSKK